MTRTEILAEASRIISKDRNATHGEPEANFKTIAEYWTTFLHSCGLLQPDTKIQSHEIATMMVLMKVSRLATSPEHLDHWIDIAGYAGCGGGVATKGGVLPGTLIGPHTFATSDNPDNPYCDLCGATGNHTIHKI